MAAKKKAAAPRRRVTQAERDRDTEERRLNALGRRAQEAGENIDLAAYYWGDGAYDTARLRLGDALRGLERVAKALRDNSWHVRRAAR